jgi:hypothetical protein
VKKKIVGTDHDKFEGNAGDTVTIECMHTNWEHTV